MRVEEGRRVVRKRARERERERERKREERRGETNEEAEEDLQVRFNSAKSVGISPHQLIRWLRFTVSQTIFRESRSTSCDLRASG